jgi:type I restriction enzyme S subunit
MKTTGAIHDGWLVLRDTNGRLNEDYLYYLLGSAYIYREFNKLAAGSTVRNLNISLAGSVKIPVPPLEEQIRIAVRIAECERASSLGARNCDERSQRLSELREVVLHKAFAGDL